MSGTDVEDDARGVVVESTLEFGDDVGFVCSGVVEASPVDWVTVRVALDVLESTVSLLIADSVVVSVVFVLDSEDVADMGVEEGGEVVDGESPELVISVCETDLVELGTVSEVPLSFGSVVLGVVLVGCGVVDKETIDSVVVVSSEALS